MDPNIERANKQKLIWGILLIVGPGLLIILALLIYSVVNFVFLVTGSSNGGIITTVVNILLYIVGAAAVIGIVPGLVFGIILLAGRKDPRVAAPQTPAQTAYGPAAPAVLAAPPAPEGRTLSIIGLVFAFVGLAPVGLILSIIGLRQSKKGGHSDVIAILGVIFNALAVLVIALYASIVIVAFATRNTTRTTQSPESSQCEGAGIQAGASCASGSSDTTGPFND